MSGESGGSIPRSRTAMGSSLEGWLVSGSSREAYLAGSEEESPDGQRAL